MYRPTWVEINLDNLAFNFQQVKNIVGERVGILAAVKANAYGHSMREVCQRLEQCGVDYFGVSSVNEAADLREANISAKILILGSLLSEQEMRLALNLNAEITVPDYRSAEILNKLCSAENKAKLHLKIDTGMGRLGVWHNNALDFVSKVIELEKVQVKGIYTHLPSSGSDFEFTQKQISIFQDLIVKIKKNKINIQFFHIANSTAVCRFKKGFFNLVRPGIMLYGIYPCAKKFIGFDLQLKPVLSFKTKIVYLKDVPAGRTISYSGTFTTKKKTKIATLAVGYADGYRRGLSNKARVLVKGEFAQVVGNVCMGQTMIDVGHIPDVCLGDQVTLIGVDKDKTITVEELADICATITYEIICGISARVPRKFIRNTDTLLL
ncbi:MAG: alanine racemase [Candidatus Omnitrophota bacterium]|nr:MAG: alanine racemase [Candidatus Omnitrophota bacterium]